MRSNFPLKVLNRIYLLSYVSCLGSFAFDRVLSVETRQCVNIQSASLHKVAIQNITTVIAVCQVQPDEICYKLELLLRRIDEIH